MSARKSRRSARPSPLPSPPQVPRRARPQRDRIAIVLALLAIAIRLPHLDWGLPEIGEEALPARKALDMWNWPNPLDLDPRTAGWPSLSFYVHLLLQHVDFAVGRAFGTFSDRNDYFVAAWLDTGRMVLLSRALDVVLAGVIVWVGARLARRLTGAAGGWLAGGLLALSPLLVEHAQMVEPDMLVALFAALAVPRIVDILERGRRADYLWAGVWIGLGISSKYTPVLLLPAVLLADQLFSRGRRARPSRAGLWLALIAAALAFGVTSPFLWLNPTVLARDLVAQGQHMAGGHFGQEATSGAGFYVMQVLGPGLGWSGFVLAAAGLGWAAWSRRGPWLVLAACFLPYFLGLALLQTQFPRYMLPLLMPLALGLAAWVPAVRERWPASASWILALGGVVAMLPAAVGAWRYHQAIARPSTEQAANQFAREIAGGGRARIFSEVLAVTVPTPRTVAGVSPLLLNALTPAQRARVAGRAIYNVDYLPMYMIAPERSAYYYDLRHTLAHDFIVTSGSVRARYESDSARYAPQVRFYADLDHYGTQVRSYGGTPGVRGPEIRFYRVSPESAAALLRDRGEMPVDSAAVAAAEPRAPDWMTFSEAVGRAALARGLQPMAERYLRASLRAGLEAGSPAARQVEIIGILERLDRTARP